MINYKLPENILNSLKNVLPRTKLDNIAFCDVFALLQSIEKLEKIEEKAEVKKEETK